MIKVLRNLDHFEMRHPGAFQAYLREALLNLVRDLGRRPNHRHVELNGEAVDPRSSPLIDLLGREWMTRYEQAVGSLSEREQALVFLRLEQDWSFQEIAEEVQLRSPDAARMAFNRALVRLAEELRDGTE
jgi:RNA polymerase sigma factor (sigma-70 family)